MHLSADVEEGDVVVYRTGNWQVDGVTVGDDSKPPTFCYARIETIQIVWTHNCEHGVLRGIPLKLKEVRGEGGDKQFLALDDKTEDLVEFGPEQLVAKIAVDWEGDNGTQGNLLAQVSYSLWESNS